MRQRDVNSILSTVRALALEAKTVTEQRDALLEALEPLVFAAHVESLSDRNKAEVRNRWNELVGRASAAIAQAKNQKNT